MRTLDPRPLAIFTHAFGQSTLDFRARLTSGQDRLGVAHAFLAAWAPLSREMGFTASNADVYVDEGQDHLDLRGVLSPPSTLPRVTLTDALIAVLTGAGARPRSLGLLGWETAQPGQGGRYAQALEKTLAWRRNDPTWRERFLAVLARDVAVGATRHPDLIIEAQLDMTPNEQVLLVSIMRTSRNRQEPFPLWITADTPLALVAERLVERGWIEGLVAVRSRMGNEAQLYATRGQKTRQIGLDDVITWG